MFENMKNIASMMGQAKQMGAKMEQFKDELGTIIVEGEAGAGAVRVRVNGKMEVLGVKLDRAMLMTLAAPPAPIALPKTAVSEVFGSDGEAQQAAGNTDGETDAADHSNESQLAANDDDLHMIEDLIAAATSQALTKVKKAVQEKLSELTGGLNIPGLDGLI